MTEPIIDDAVRATISTGGLGRTLFVEAGAGTGKTTQLVDRIANLVVVEGVPMANIAAITFTEAAAAELQSRIRVKFETMAAQATDPGALRRCQDAIAQSDAAAISTLHGFASRLLNEFAVDAGLPPRLRVLDEISSQLAHEERWERFVDALHDDPANEAVLTVAALVDVPLEPRYQGHATLKDVAAELNQNWDRIESIAVDVPPPLGELDFSDFDAAVAAVCALPSLCEDVSDKFYVHLTEKLIPEMTAVAQIDDPGRKLRALTKVKWTRGKGGRAAAWGGDVKGCQALVPAVCEAASAVVADVADAVLRHLLVAIAREVLEAALARCQDGGLEFHDLLVLAREMLRRSPRARATLHDRYTHLLLDEFQDTDPIQIELAMLIAASVDDEVPGHWSDLHVDDGRLFFVGDPKQSIYRFRRADIGLFLAARDRFGAGGNWLQLVSNFRTLEPILQWVNALFDREMSEELAGRQPKYEPLHAYRPAPPGSEHRPVVLGGPHPDPKVKADALRECEAESVAHTISDIRERPERWRVLDELTREWRPARLSDVTILVPARTSVPFLRAALAAADIPYRLATGTLVYDTQEVRDALSALRAIDDPTDEISLVAALRSPLYACSDVDLFTYRAAGGRWNLRAEPPESVEASHPVRLALEHLRTLWSQRWWTGPAALLDRLLRERQAHLLAFGDPRPKEVWHRLRFLVDQAREFEESGGGGLRAFVDWADLQGAEGARVHEPLLPETDDDAVRIMTIHGSKGLEFPITVLSGMTTKPGNRRRGVSVLWDESGPPEVSLRKGVATANHEPRADIELEMDQYEKLRLLYVAATRARDHLIVSCHHKVSNKPSDTYAGRMWSFCDEHPDLWRRLEREPGPDQLAAGRLDAPDVPSGEVGGGGVVGRGVAGGELAAGGVDAERFHDDRDRWIDAREALIAPHRDPRVLSATAIARAALGAEDGDELEAEDDDLEQADDLVVPARRRGRAGTAIGRAVHATLQMVDLEDPHDIDLHVRRQCDIESIPDHVAVVAGLVRSALAAPSIRAAASAKHHKELFVAAPMGQRVIEGYVDLLVEGPEGLVVIDYKTDTVVDDAAIDDKLGVYELQGAAYAAAIEHVTGRPVVDCRFVFCSMDGAIERSVTDLPGAVARVREIVGV